MKSRGHPSRKLKSQVRSTIITSSVHSRHDACLRRPGGCVHTLTHTHTHRHTHTHSHIHTHTQTFPTLMHAPGQRGKSNYQTGCFYRQVTYRNFKTDIITTSHMSISQSDDNTLTRSFIHRADDDRHRGVFLHQYRVVS